MDEKAIIIAGVILVVLIILYFCVSYYYAKGCPIGASRIYAGDSTSITGCYCNPKYYWDGVICQYNPLQLMH